MLQLNHGNQSGGTKSDKQLFEVRYRTPSGWERPNFRVGDDCGANSNLTDWACVVLDEDGTAFSNRWRAWDRSRL